VSASTCWTDRAILTCPDLHATLGVLTIRLNGEPYELPGPLSVAALLARLQIDPRRVAVERNTVVVRRPAYDTTLVEEGDEIEIVNIVGGGAGAVRARPRRARGRSGRPRGAGGAPGALRGGEQVRGRQSGARACRAARHGGGPGPPEP
jgi:thiamine biosynthesis protein ThiS